MLYQSIETLSKGYLHRACFAQSILHDPPILVLDEPTDGLDPNQKHEVRTLIREMGRNKAIVFSTHILEEVDAACTRAIIIDRGRIVANGTPEELRAQSEVAGAVLLTVKGKPAAEIAQKLRELPLVRRAEAVAEKDGAAQIRAYPKPEAGDGELGARVFELAARECWTVLELRREEGRLDEVFRKITLPDTKPEKEREIGKKQ